MTSAKYSWARYVARLSLPVVLIAMSTASVRAAVQNSFSFSTVWSMPPMTVTAPLSIARIIPEPITVSPPITVTPPIIAFPIWPPAPIGPVMYPMSPTLSTTAASTAPTSTAANVAAVVSGNNQFAYDLYGALDQTNTGNMVYSPYSISTALAMTYAGAAGQTATEMAQTMHFTLPESQLAPAMGQLIGETNTSGGTSYQLSVANHLWGQTGIPFLGSFVNTTSADYHAPLTQLDFLDNPDGSRQTINAWTANQTNQKIQNLLPQGSITSVTALVLTNAVYFEDSWRSPFNPSETAPETFYLSNGSLESVSMMHQLGSFKYAAFQGYSMLDLPYSGGDISMLAILPSQTSSLANVEASLNSQTLAQDESQLAATRVEVGLPKFTVSSQFNLSATLASMGMPSAFDQHRANFSGMSPVPLHISDVVHEAYISVDEQGTEAAGATGVVTAGPTFVTTNPTSADFDADRPFDFVLRDDKTGSILFMGRVSDPGGTPIVTPLAADTYFTSLLSGSNTYEPPDAGSGGTFGQGGTLIVAPSEPIEDGSNLYVGTGYETSLFGSVIPAETVLPASGAIAGPVTTAVPEPSALALLLTAGAALATWKCRAGRASR